MHREVVLRPVGHVRGGRGEAGDDSWDAVEARIELDAAQFGPDALAGLTDFSHVEVVFHFDRVPDAEIVTAARHPRGRSDWPRVGIFAQRGKGRLGRIDVTACRLLAVDGLALMVRGLDAIDGTPVLDIKPVMTGFLARGPIRQPRWADEIMTDYW